MTFVYDESKDKFSYRDSYDPFRVFLVDGLLIPTHNKIVGKELPVFINDSGYEIVYNPEKDYYVSIYKIVDYYYRGPTKKNTAIHHKDFNKLNNNISNLKRMDGIKHIRYHSKLLKGKKADPKRIAKMVKTRTGMKATEEAKRNQSKGMKKSWKKNPNQGFTGMKHSPEAIEKIRKLQLGKKFSEEHRKKMSESAKRRPLPEALRINADKPKFGDDNPMRNPEIAAKVSRTKTGRKLIIDKDGKRRFVKESN